MRLDLLCRNLKIAICQPLQQPLIARCAPVSPARIERKWGQAASGAKCKFDAKPNSQSDGILSIFRSIAISDSAALRSGSPRPVSLAPESADLPDKHIDLVDGRLSRRLRVPIHTRWQDRSHGRSYGQSEKRAAAESLPGTVPAPAQLNRAFVIYGQTKDKQRHELNET